MRDHQSQVRLVLIATVSVMIMSRRIEATQNEVKLSLDVFYFFSMLALGDIGWAMVFVWH